MRKLLFIPFLLSICLMAQSQKITNLFTEKTEVHKNSSKYLAKSQTLSINMDVLTSAARSKSPVIELEIPFESNTLVLELKKVSITTNDFSVIAVSNTGEKKSQNYENSTFYHGSIKGQPGTFASVSIFDDHIVGVFADKTSNIIIEPIIDEVSAKKTKDYLLYRENDILVENPFTCHTPDLDYDTNFSNEHITPLENNVSIEHNEPVGPPIEIYLECDYDLYTKKGSDIKELTKYVLGFFNSVALLFRNEQLVVQVSQIKVWTTPDPESSIVNPQTLNPYLTSFEERVGDFKGDFAHFLSTKYNLGGIAYRSNSPCGIEKKSRTGISMISTTYTDFPTENYSWTIQVVTHELGHNFGSNHTQWCGWPGGAIDNCYATEPVNNNSCPAGPPPNGGGTIMSYCHTTAYGINMANGFGTLPGNKIRELIGNANCFATCSMTIEIEKFGFGCAGQTGSARVNATNATGNLTYLWSTGETTPTISNLGVGTYYVTVRDAAGCEVIDDFTITANETNDIDISISPASNVGFCPGQNVTLTATRLDDVTYAWYLDNVLINQATGRTHTTNIPGKYKVILTRGICTFSSPEVQVNAWSNPSFSLSTATPTIHKFELAEIISSSNAYSYNWNQQSHYVSSLGNNRANFNPPSDIEYTITATSPEGCQSSQSISIAVIGCGTVSNFAVENYSPSRVKVSWQNPFGVETDSLYYRKVGDADWTAIFVDGDSYELNNLTPGTDYQYRVVPLCSTTSIFVSSATQSFSTAALQSNLYLRIFPNPISSSTDTRIEVITNANTQTGINLYDMAGRLVKVVKAYGTSPTNSSINTLNTKDLAAGIYLIVVTVNDEKYTERLLITP